MESLIITNSQKGNNYYIITNKKFVGYAHPILAWIYSFEKNNKSLDNIPKNIKINEIGEISEDIITYYTKKYLFLKECGLQKIERKDEFNGCISKQIVDYKIANLNQLTLEVTDACNLKCKYCGYGEFYSDYDIRKNKILSFDIAKNIIDYVVDKWNSTLNSSYEAKSYISFYGGEPLLGISLIKEIINYIKTLKVNREIVFSMTTNGLLLDKHMDFLYEHEIFLLISLDGDSYNNSYRVDHKGNSSFKKLMQNINLLSQKYPNYFADRVSFNSVLHDRNSVEDIHFFIKENFNQRANISQLNNSGIKKDKLIEFHEMFKNYYDDLIKSSYYHEITNELFLNTPDNRALTIFISQYSGNFYESYIDFFVDNERTIKIPTGTCFPFGKKMYITVNGKILPCERIGHQFQLGLVAKNSINLNTSEIAKKYNLYYNKIRKQCTTCYNIYSCSQCIFNLDDIDDKTVNCIGYTNLKKFKKYLSFIISYLENNPLLYKRIMKEVVID